MESDPPPPPAAAAPASAPCWSSVLQAPPPPAPQEPVSNKVFTDCKSSKGISVAVVDANAIIHGDKISGIADKFVTLREVFEEVRDPVSRHRLSFLPLAVDTMEPSPDAIKKVVKFARETGDLQTLSDVDLKLIALTYMLEAQIHGASHLRESPPPLRVVNARTFNEAPMPGWGNNVPNLAEWEALEQATDGGLGSGSRVLPLKDLDDNIIPVMGDDSQPADQYGEHPAFGRPRKFNFPKREIKTEGKMVAVGIDATHGEDTENADDWQPAVSRSTHRRFLRRKARRDLSKEAEENDLSKEAEENDLPSGEGSEVPALIEDDGISDDYSVHADSVACKASLEAHHETELSEKAGLVDGNPREDSVADASRENIEEGSLEDTDNATEENEIVTCTMELNDLEISSNADGSIDTFVNDDASSEQSWMLRSLSESTVACVTSDFAMQNVILQIGLRLLAPGGMQIRQLHRWVLKCHACNKVTQEIGRIFCPKCGNGGTLRKVSVTVGENGIVLAARRQRNILRGTKFSLPMPQGGRDAVTKNPILREDQLPHKLLYPKSKKKQGKQDDFLGVDDIFTHAGDKRVPLKPPVRKALAMFSGRRNPNDNHFSRAKH